ncbi:MAG: protein kinase [Kofleriaceae bacterium]|nr:protein kinase [Kofleriaceae bacterium]
MSTHRPGNATYILGERIASGGMAEIFHAERRVGGGTPLVIKQMLPQLAAHQDYVSMFIEEARISTNLDHPNIVKVHDFEATDRGLFLVMELVDGPDLLAVMTRCASLGRTISPAIAAYIACHALEALDYAHTACSPAGERLHVVHRDVSPSNIMVTRRGHVKLADFGIARASALGRTSEVAAGTLKGKFGYMSPEQVRGDELDGRSDVFSMGVVLAEMMTLKRVFNAPDDVELLLMVRRGDLRRLEQYGGHIPRGLDTIIRKALSVDRELRYQTADEMRNALVEWLEASTERTGAGRLAALLRELEEQGGELCSWKHVRPRSTPVEPTLSGSHTMLARRAATEQAVRGRQAFARARNEARSTAVDLAPFRAPAGAATPPPEPAAPAAPQPRAVTQLERPRGYTEGTLGRAMVIDLLCEIARERRTGALTIKHGAHYREAYFVDGQPVYVGSNVEEDRFGEFLVQRKTITRDQLDRALSVLEHFGGRLGRALVSLGLLQPVDAVRLLAAQVAAKLVRACQWIEGSFEFRPHELNPWPALALELRTLPIVGNALSTIPAERLVIWAKRVMDCPTSFIPDRARAFEFEPAVVDELEKFAVPARTLRTVIDEIPTPPQRLLVTAAAYVAWRTGMLRFLKPR